MMPLNSTPSMQSAFCGEVGEVSLFFGFEVTKMERPLGDVNSGAPLIETWANAHEIGFLIQEKLPPILKVCLLWDIPEIANSVVCFYPVNVVYVIYGLHSMYPQPRHPVSVFFPSTDLKDCVAIAVRAFNLAPARVPMDGIEPCENTGIRVVVKVGFKLGCSKRRICNSHAVSPVKKWFGQKPQSVSALLGLRHFSADTRRCIRRIVGNVVQKKNEGKHDA